jgi:hypothetical protein
MNVKENELQKYQNLAYHYAIYKIGNQEAAKDISSQTINLFLLKAEAIESAEPWIIKTCNNYCMQYVKSETNKTKLESNLQKSLFSLISEELIEKDEALYQSYEQTLSEFSLEDIKIIFFYNYCEQNAKRMSQLTGESYSKLRKRIYRIKKTIKAETYRNIGIIASEKIVTPKLNDLITVFLKRFKTNLENKTLSKMYYYFSEVDLKKYNPGFEIIKIIDYRLNLHDNIYTVYVLFETKNEDVQSFYIKFYINEKNHLKIIAPPTKIKKPVMIDIESDKGMKIKQLLDKYPENRTGMSKIPKGELEKILQDI